MNESTPPVNGFEFITRLNAQLEILEAGKPLLLLSGFSEEELRGHSIFDFIHTEDREALTKYYNSLTDRAQAATSVYRFRKKDGSYTLLQSQGSFRTEESGADIIVTSILVDGIAEAVLRPAGLLSRRVGHDLANVVMGIRGSVQLIRQNPAHEPLAGFLRDIDFNAERVVQLSDELRAFGKRLSDGAPDLAAPEPVSQEALVDIMIVNEDALINEMLTRVLTQLGYRPHFAATADDAAEFSQNDFTGELKVLFVSATFPFSNTLPDAVQAYQNKYLGITVVVLVESPFDLATLNIPDKSGVRVLNKPFKIQDLMQFLPAL